MRSLRLPAGPLPRGLLRGLVIGLLLASCAGRSTGPGAAPAAAPARRSSDEISLQLFAALQRGDLGDAIRDFSPRLSQALPPPAMRDVWRQIVQDAGPLRSYRIVDRLPVRGLEARVLLLEFERLSARAELAIHPDSNQIEELLIRPAAAAAAAPPSAAARPPVGSSTALPGGGRAIEVVVGKAPWTLGGTLALPAGSGPFPAVVLIHGSGPQDRDQTLGPNKPFADLALALANKGIASLRYDKRTYVYRNPPDPQKFTVEDEVLADGVAAVELLRSRPEIRRDGIFVAGHSLGAQLAPEIAERAAPLAGLILLAPPARPLATIIVDQVRFLKAMPPAQLAELDRQAEAIRTGRARAGERFLGVPVEYFLDLQRRNAFRVARALGRPILLLRGERDYQVTAEDARIWRTELRGQDGVRAYDLPGLNHLFIAGSGPPGPQELTTAGQVHPSVAVRMAAFIKTVLATARAALAGD